MKDDIRERLSAYLDGALTETQRRNVEVEIERSEEMRREFEALRAVSTAVKGLGKEKLPEGFLARLQARRARQEATPHRNYRPLALALSTAVIALVIWDRTRSPRELLKPLPEWDGTTAALQSAPASIGEADSLTSAGSNDKALDNNVVAQTAAERKMTEPVASSVPLIRAGSADARLAHSRRSVSAVRSAIGNVAAPAAAPATPATPIVNAIVLRNAAALMTAWTTAGLSGQPPFVDFSSQMAIFLSGPPGSGIVSVQAHMTSIVVLYRDTGFDDAFARVRAVAPSSKPVIAKLAN